MNVQDITVDLSKKNIKPESIVLRQGDKSGTTLRVKVLDNGVNVSSLSGYTAKFIMKLPYNRFYYEVEGTISGSMLTFVIDESYAAVQSGVTNIAYVALVNGDVTRMSANNIRVEILPSALDGFTPPPEWTDPIDEFIEEQTARVDTIVTNAESATTAANTAATNANGKAALADTAATNANAKAGLADEAATNANAKAQEADEAAEAADAAREAIQDDLAAKANKDGHYSLFGAGTSDALMSTDGEVDTFAQRVSDHDVGVRIESLRGRTVVWNQLAEHTLETRTVNGVTITNNGDGSFTLNGTATAQTAFNTSTATTGVSNHKLLIKGCPSGGGIGSYRLKDGYGNISDLGNGTFETHENDMTISQIIIANGYTASNLVFRPQIFDLTRMFGAGNEPATVAEFEALFPERYYTYDAGSLLSVNIEGIESVGFNQFDDELEVGGIGSSGENINVDSRMRTKNYIPVFPGTAYYICCQSTSATYSIYYYDANKGLISINYPSMNAVITMPENARYIGFMPPSAYGLINKHDICVNLSDPIRNGTYEPYRKFTRQIPVDTYFADGMRSAGSVYDELRSDKAITRIGSVDLGTLNWIYDASNNYFATTGITSRKPGFNALKCVKYETASSSATTTLPNNQIVGGTGSVTVYIRDSNYTNAATFKAAMSGVMLYYELATPTETAIDPPLNLAYPTEQGGTESIIIPTGEMSAAPTMAIVYAYDADGVRDLSQAIIATIEGNTASTNYAIGGYFVHAGMLYKATSAIATGETINPGTNCVQTTVMAELVALTA